MTEVKVDLEWFGDRLTERVREAAGRGVVEIAQDAAGFSKDIVAIGNPGPPEYDDHPGTLRRSITIGLPGETHESDETRAIAGEDLLATAAIENPVEQLRSSLGTFLSGDQIRVEVGSWIAYACVEETRRPYIHPGVEMSRASAIPTMVEAFRVEFG